MVILPSELNKSKIYQSIENINNYTDTIDFNVNNSIYLIDMSSHSGMLFDTFNLNDIDNLPDGAYTWEVLVKFNTSTFMIDVDIEYVWIDKTSAFSLEEGEVQKTLSFIIRLIKNGSNTKWLFNYSHSY